MSAKASDSSLLWSPENLWRGPPASSISSKVKPVASSVRVVKRKPVPTIPAELLQQHLSSSSSVSTLIATTPVQAAETVSFVTDTVAPPTHESPSSLTLTASSIHPPQRHYLLEIDTPFSSQDDQRDADDSVQQLLRSTPTSPSPAVYRPRKGPLKWVADREEHAANASSSTLSVRQPTLSRKTSISAHLKLSLRRNKTEDQPGTSLTISAPTNFVHICTGAEAPSAVSNSASLRRTSTTSHRFSQHSSTSSSLSRTSLDTANSSSHEQAVNEDKPLYAALEKKNPLRPLKSIRRPSKLSLNQLEPVLNLPNGHPTSPKDKRKGIYAAPGSVPEIFEPAQVSTLAKASTPDPNPLASPVTSRAGEHFAAQLDRSIDRARGHSSNRGDLSPEPELSRSPGSGYGSSMCASNRSSLGSLHEFRTFLDFPDLMSVSRRNSDKEKNEDDLWSGSALATPVHLQKF